MPRPRNRRKPVRSRTSEPADLAEAKIHFTKAGHELFLAAEGLLNFCKSYVEQKSTEKPYRDWVRYISRKLALMQRSKAFNMISDIGSNMLRNSTVKQAADMFSNIKM